MPKVTKKEKPNGLRKTLAQTQFSQNEEDRIIEAKRINDPTNRMTVKAFIERLALLGLAAEEQRIGGDKAK